VVVGGGGVDGGGVSCQLSVWEGWKHGMGDRCYFWLN
jgi:hypothetical protein